MKTNKIRIIVMLLLVVSMCFGMFACSQTPAAQSSAPAASSAPASAAGASSAAPASAAPASQAASAAGAAKDYKDITIALVPKVAVPFFDDCNNGGKSEAATLGVNYEWIAPQDAEPETQVNIVNDLISKHVDGFALSCNEPKSMEAVFKQATDAGIKVITFDSDSPDSTRLMYIGTVNETAGELMGDSLAKLIAKHKMIKNASMVNSLILKILLKIPDASVKILFFSVIVFFTIFLLLIIT